MDADQVPFESCLRQAFALYRTHFLTLLLSHMAMVGVSFFSAGILVGPMTAGVIRITLDLLDNRRPPPQAGDIFLGLRFFLPTLLLSLFLAIAGAICVRILRLLHLGPLALMGPVIPLTATFFALFFIVERDMEWGPAIQASWERVKPIFWPLAGLLAIGWGAALIGLLAFRIGIVVTLPFYTCLAAVVWRCAEPPHTRP